VSRRVLPGAVLVGVDGSIGSDVALAWASTYARSQRRPLAVVHAVVPPADEGDLGDVTRDAVLSAGRALVTESVTAVLGVDGDDPVDVHVCVGDPREVAVELAEHASMLVVGSRGRGPVRSLLLGSVSAALAAHAPCPVVVVRPEPVVAAVDSRRPVVLGLDADQLGGYDGEHDEHDPAGTLTFAIELASAQHRPLEVVHAAGGMLPFPSPDVASAELIQQSMAAAEQLLADCLEESASRFPDVDVTSRLVVESATQALVAASEHAEVVVVGCRGRGPARSRLLGSVSRSVVERAHCTVVVVRSRAT
jgi:nucleotide-binding universal stress UspA family protein